ncbi:hypothetical protein [Alkalicoccus luteus]|uniref:Uncharacterized protein n=1 Tax=Alkalicoccus luteus TaxID=1237094 RepID=A0A969PRV8_9BACI|nr:hypothetical protein [Alkalicoccus luteus]NJP37904.1 hypothetical protein [Alkalicoccus luteus]
MDLLTMDRVNQYLEIGNEIVRKSKSDLMILAVNKVYGLNFICLNSSQRIGVYTFNGEKIQFQYPVDLDWGTNYIVVHEDYQDYQSFHIKKGKSLLSVPRKDLQEHFDLGYVLD